MALLSILTYPDQRLKQVSSPVESVDDGLRAFIADLEETMRHGPGGVGIAAPQVGNFIRVAIVDVSVKNIAGKPKIPQHGRLILINPEITKWDGMKVGREGCMSVPDFTGNVIRAEQIKLNYLDERGEAQTIEATGYEARAIQHEMDHLDGMLFLDRLVSRRNDLFKRKVYK